MSIKNLLQELLALYALGMFALMLGIAEEWNRARGREPQAFFECYDHD